MNLPKSKIDARYEFIEFTSASHAIEVASAMGVATKPGNAEMADDIAKMKNDWSCYCGATEVSAMMGIPPAEILRAVDVVRERIESIMDVPTQVTRRRRYGLDDGAELDPIAWVQRDPYGWSDTLREPKPKRIIRIGVNLTLVWWRKQEELVYRGAAVLAMADILSSLGHDVEIVAYDVGDNFGLNRKRVVATVPVKQSDAPMNLAAIAVSIAHVAFLRTVIFPAIYRVIQSTGEEGCGQQIGNIPEELARTYDIVVEKDTYTLDQAVDAVRSAVGAFSAP
jgi:hypothetical protein